MNEKWYPTSARASEVARRVDETSSQGRRCVTEALARLTVVRQPDNDNRDNEVINGWPPRDQMTLDDEERWVLVTFEEHLWGEHLEDNEPDWRSLFEYMRHCGMGPVLHAIERQEMPDDRSVQDIILGPLPLAIRPVRSRSRRRELRQPAPYSGAHRVSDSRGSGEEGASAPAATRVEATSPATARATVICRHGDSCSRDFDSFTHRRCSLCRPPSAPPGQGPRQRPPFRRRLHPGARPRRCH